MRQVADATKLSTRVIDDLERGAVDKLPPGVYRRSLVRAVAREVGLDPEKTLRAFLEECPDDLPPPGGVAWVEPARPAARGWARLFAVLGVAVPLAAGTWYVTTVHDTHSASGGGAPVSQPPAARPASGWNTEVVPAGGFLDAPPPPVRPVSMLITISGRCRLRVVADGSPLVDRVFQAGESLQVAFSDAVELDGDNAGVVQYSLNGRAGRLLGGSGDPLAARIGRDDYTFFVSGR